MCQTLFQALKTSSEQNKSFKLPKGWITKPGPSACGSYAIHSMESTNLDD